MEQGCYKKSRSDFLFRVFIFTNFRFIALLDISGFGFSAMAQAIIKKGTQTRGRKRHHLQPPKTTQPPGAKPAER